MPAPTRRDFLAGAASVLAAAAIDFPSARADDTKPVGWAIVGIGKLSKGQILPAMKKCSKAKLVAVVTGHPVENKAVIDDFGIAPEHVYNYDNFDTLANNPD